MADSELPAQLVARIESNEITEDIASEAITRLRKAASPADVVAQSILALLTRVANSWTSIHALTTHDDDRVQARCKQDVGAVFRIMFEAYVQLAFILHDPEKRTERASLFLDFGIVERMKTQDRVFRHDSSIARALRRSPLRDTGEQSLQAEFARVADRFLKSRKKAGKVISVSDVRDRWYEGTLWTLIREIGVESQADMWIGQFHACIHSSISGCKDGCIMGIEHASFWASQIVAHCVKLCLDYAEVALPNHLQDWVDAITETPLGELSEYDGDE